MPDNVATESKYYKECKPKWDLIDHLLGGTVSMRKANTKYLPMEEKESLDKYNRRLVCSVLFNGTRDAVNRIVNKPFSKPMVLGEEKLPAKLKFIGESASDKPAGFRFHSYARKLFRCAVKYGVAHGWVDYPTLTGQENKLEEKEMGIQPIFNVVSPQSVIGWISEKMPNGESRLTEVRFVEYHDIPNPDNKYDMECIKHVRILRTAAEGATEGTWELWQQSGSSEDKYTLKENGVLTYDKGQSLPWVTLYLNAEEDAEILTGTPCFEDLAWVNVAHWQSYSDQRNILRFARMGILVSTGFSDEESEHQDTIGPNTVFRSRNADANMKYCEHSGAAIGSGRDDLKDLEEVMHMYGMRPFLSKTGDETATGKSIDEANSQTDAGSWVMSLEDTLGDVVRVAGVWVDEQVDKDYKPKISQDFGLSIREQAHLTMIMEMRRNRDLSRATTIKESQRRGVLSETVTVEEEESLLESEGPDMTMIGLQGMEEGKDKEEEETGEDDDKANPFDKSKVGSNSAGY